MDFASVKRINQLEAWSKTFRVRAYKNNPLTPTVFRKAQERFSRIEEKVLEGSSQEAIFAYRTLFRRVEGAALVVERYSRLAKAMRKSKELKIEDYSRFFQQEDVFPPIAKESGNKIGNEADLVRELKATEKILKKHYRRLGNHFDEYNHVRRKMEGLRSDTACSTECAKAMDEALENLGMASAEQRALFQPLLGAKGSYTLREVRALFNSHPEALVIARKKEFIQEGIALLKKYVKKFNLLQKALSFLANTSLGRKKALMPLFKSIFDKRYIDSHALGAKRIAYSDLGPAQKFSLMEEETKNFDQQAFWMNFSRVKEGQMQKTWKELLSHATREKPATADKMLAAQELGRSLGPVSDQSLRGALAFLSVAALGGAGWAYFNFEEDESGERGSPPGGFQSMDASGASDPDDLQDLEPTVLIDYLKGDDEEVIDSLREVYELDQELAKQELAKDSP